MMQKQIKLEKEDSNTDRSAEPSAAVISELCKMLAKNESERLVLGEFGYYVGRWIYLMDAADDLEDDIKHGRFNPYKKAAGDNMSEAAEYCNSSLNMTVARIIQAYDLLDIGLYRDILDNIVYQGLAYQQKFCLFDKRQKNIKNRIIRLENNQE